MSQDSVRVRRVRFKHGGDVHLLPQPDRSEVQQELIGSAVELVRDVPDMAGFALIVWNEGGDPVCHTWIDIEGCPALTPALAPAFVHDALLTHLAMDYVEED